MICSVCKYSIADRKQNEKTEFSFIMGCGIIVLYSEKEEGKYMRKKKQNEGNFLGVMAVLLLLMSVVIGRLTDYFLCCLAIGFALIFTMLSILYSVEQKKIAAAGVLINAYVTDCEQVKHYGENPTEKVYRLMCEVDDTRVYGTTELISTKYVPIGGRIVIYYDPEKQFVCLASEINSSKIDIVTFSAALLSFIVAGIGYLAKRYENTPFLQDNMMRIVAGFFSFCFLIMGIAFFLISGKNKRQAVDNHAYPAVLIRYYYRFGRHRDKYPVWKYHYKGENVEYESMTEMKLWQKIGTRSEVYVSEDGEVFEKSEVRDLYAYGYIFSGMGIVLAIGALFYNF